MVNIGPQLANYTLSYEDVPIQDIICPQNTSTSCLMFSKNIVQHRACISPQSGVTMLNTRLLFYEKPPCAHTKNHLLLGRRSKRLGRSPDII